MSVKVTRHSDDFFTIIGKNPNCVAEELAKILKDETIPQERKDHMLRVYNISNMIIGNISKTLQRESTEASFDILTTLTQNLTLSAAKRFVPNCEFEVLKHYFEKCFNNALSFRDLYAEVHKRN